MARKSTLLLLILFLANCGVVKKKTTYSVERSVSVEATPSGARPPDPEPVAAEIPEKADLVINTALTYTGVRYKFGGANRQGMDCSGLLYVAFGAHDVPLPRVSYEMANQGRRIRVDQVTKGDLLFFKTQNKGKRINHVGLVVEVGEDDIKFIHSTSSRGVIVSSLREGFWNYAFVKATRVL